MNPLGAAAVHDVSRRSSRHGLSRGSIGSTRPVTRTGSAKCCDENHNCCYIAGPWSSPPSSDRGREEVVVVQWVGVGLACPTQPMSPIEGDGDDYTPGWGLGWTARCSPNCRGCGLRTDWAASALPRRRLHSVDCKPRCLHMNYR